MIQPDLIARTCGGTAVLSALIFMGFLIEPEFAITPQQRFDKIELSLAAPAPQAKASMPPVEETEPAPLPVEPQVEPQATPPLETPQPTTTATTPPLEPKVDPQPQAQVKSQPVKETTPAPVVPVKQEKTKATPTPTQPKSTKAHQPEAKPAPRPTPAKPVKERPTQVKAQPTAKEVKPPRHTSKATTTPQEHARSTTATTTATGKTAPRAAQQQALSSLLIQEIKNRLIYPRKAIRRNLVGTVVIKFIITDGHISSYQVHQSSGHRILDNAAAKLADSLIGFRIGGNSDNDIIIPIKYELI